MSSGANDADLAVVSDLGRLAPAFRARVEAALAACVAQGLDVKVYETYRSAALQALYYQRGRTIIPPRRPVTNARSHLQSWHGFGLAVDVVHRTKFWKPEGGEAWFARVAKVFKANGCNWGGDWRTPDPPHFQWARCPPSPSDAVRALHASQGERAVWTLFEAAG